MRRLLALALLTWPAMAAAQAPASPAVSSNAGDSMRVSLRSGLRLEGSLQRWTLDSVSLRRVVGSRTTDTVMALSHVSIVEARVRRHTAGSAFKGMGLGLLAGSALGALATGFGYLGCSAEVCEHSNFLIPVGAVAGGVSGLLVGAKRTTSAWDIVWRAEGVGP